MSDKLSDRVDAIAGGIDYALMIDDDRKGDVLQTCHGSAMRFREFVTELREIAAALRPTAGAER